MMYTPLLAIRIRHSENPAIHAGQQFDTLADFDATFRAVRARAARGRVAYVLTWKDRATFHGVYNLERAEDLIENITRECRAVLCDPRLSVLLAGVQLTLKRLFKAALAERAAGRSRPSCDTEGSCCAVAP
jgi:hypothetical protein